MLSTQQLGKGWFPHAPLKLFFLIACSPYIGYQGEIIYTKSSQTLEQAS